MGQSSAFLLGGDVMRTSSPLADRQPCLCSSLEQQPQCVAEYVYVRDTGNTSVCVHVHAHAHMVVRLCYWLRGVVGKPRGT